MKQASIAAFARRITREGRGLCILATVAGVLTAPAGRLHAAAPPQTARPVSLAGEWRFELDPDDVGIAEGWYGRPLAEKVKLPGSTDENRKGVRTEREPDLNGLSRVYEYVGPAWYQRDITVPRKWRGKRLVLFLERCHWETQVWLGERYCGMQDSLCVPHVYELGTEVAPGRHRLTIRVDNRLKYNMGRAAHSTSEQTQTNWNGIVGRIELRATPRVWIAGVQVYPDVARRAVRVVASVRNATAEPFRLVVEAADHETGRLIASVTREEAGSAPEATVELELLMGAGVQLWDEFSPALYDLKATLVSRGDQEARAHEVTTVFGMRDLRVRGKRLVLNGRPIFLRGTLECCVFPLTGYPPTEVEPWLRIFRIAKSYGLNHMRFHSWCPPEAAFEAADRMGFLLHTEAPQWVGNVGRDPPRDRFIENEVLRILDAYGNHPSFGMLCMGNELGGDVSFLERLVALGKERDPRHLYTSSTAWSLCRNNDYNVAVVRGLHGPSTDADFSAEVAKSSVPIVSHEIGQWSVFPNLAEMPKYTGVLKPRNFALVRDSLKTHHLLDQSRAFTQATGKLSAELYKEEIEVLLRTAAHSGFQLLDLHDFPGQGTALVGMLDAFWDSKGFIKPQQFRRFCGPTVPLARMSKRTFTTDETFSALIELAHYGPSDLPDAKPMWTLRNDEGREIAAGALPGRTVPTGNVHRLGAISLPLAEVAAPARLTLSVSLQDTEWVNDWHIWVFPAHVSPMPPESVLVTSSTAEALAALAEGRRAVLLASRSSLVKPRSGSFTPVFWSPVWFRRAARGTMSILCDPKHPALAGFPTEAHTDWQWYDLLQRSQTMVLDGTPPSFRPIVQVIDNFTLNQKLGNLLEARVGQGRLLVSSINLWDDLDSRPAARQLLKSVLDYAGSDAFRPRHRLSIAELTSFLREARSGVLQSLGATIVMVDSEDRASGNVARNAIDDDPDTFWHTEWVAAQPPFPHEIQVDMQKSLELIGFRYLPRQDMQNGWFQGYEFYVSEDGKDWGAPVASGSFDLDASEKTVRLDAPRRGRYLRLVALNGPRGNPWAAVAELDVIVVDAGNGRLNDVKTAQ
ncbi:MAG: discoidin domain-containing protein [Armatimonadota bacterium]